MLRKRTIKKDKDGNIIHGVVIKESQADKIGYYLIKKTLPKISNAKLLEAKAVMETSKNSSYKPLIKELIRNEFEKRGLEYVDLDSNLT